MTPKKGWKQELGDILYQEFVPIDPRLFRKRKEIQTQRLRKRYQPYGVSHFTRLCSQNLSLYDFLFSSNPALCQTCEEIIVRKSLRENHCEYSTTCLMAPFLPCFPSSSLGEKWIGRMVRRRLNHSMVRTKNDLFDARHPAA